ncbi:MAG: PilZ domain-containing protein [Spirochaetota bacterium]
MEKRDMKRWHLIYYLRVFDRNTNNLIGNLVDITTEGIMLISEKPINTNQIYYFRMDLPQAVEGKKEIQFDCQSLWCKNDVNPDFYDTGFKFVNISDNARKIITELINTFFFRD